LTQTRNDTSTEARKNKKENRATKGQKRKNTSYSDLERTKEH